MKILVVDNDNDTGVTLKALLSSNPNIDIKLMFDGKSAIQELSINNYDAVVVDIMMPEFSGLDMAKEISKSERLKNIPVILMSSALPLPPTELLATFENDNNMTAIKGVIEKPFIVETVVDVLNKVTSKETK